MFLHERICIGTIKTFTKFQFIDNLNMRLWCLLKIRITNSYSSSCRKSPTSTLANYEVDQNVFVFLNFFPYFIYIGTLMVSSSGEQNSNFLNHVVNRDSDL